MPSIREQAFSSTSRRLSPSGSILFGLRIGVPQEYFPAELSPAIIESIRDVIKDLKSQGATIVPISLPSTVYALSSYYVLASAEASSNLARYDGIQYGTLLLSSLQIHLTSSHLRFTYTTTPGRYETLKRICPFTFCGIWFGSPKAHIAGYLCTYCRVSLFPFFYLY